MKPSVSTLRLIIARACMVGGEEVVPTRRPRRIEPQWVQLGKKWPLSRLLRQEPESIGATKGESAGGDATALLLGFHSISPF